MANKQALRDLQGRLAERLQEAQSTHRSAGWLAVESAGYGFLLPLAEAGEIFQAGGLLPVPHTQRWFLGVSNLRGVLAGVVDLAGFLGLRPEAPQPVREQGHLVAFNPVLEINVALLVDRLAGLRNLDQLESDASAPPPQDGPGFVGATHRDASGRRWQEIRLAVLARDERFLRIVGGE